ncbi:MAG: tetratricopeptide repeat protein [bacterium]|nr:tetratricopeptide repeat protein [bacterium]
MRITRREAIILSVSGLILITSIAGVHVFRQQLAVLAWNTFHSGFIVTMLDPHDATLYEAMGTYYFTSAHYNIPKARTYFEKAVALDDRVAVSHFQLGRIAFIAGDFKVALAEADKEIAVEPDFMRTYYLRGLIHAYANDLDASISDFKTFLAWKPESWAAHNDLAWVFFRRGDFSDAERYAREGLSYAPSNPWLENTLGTALLNLGKYEEAQKHLLEAKRGFETMHPQDWGAAYPGNDPRVYEEGLQASRKSVADNLLIVDKKLDTQ